MTTRARLGLVSEVVSEVVSQVSYTVRSENFTVDIYDDRESGTGRSRPYDEAGVDVYDDDEGESIESVGSEHDLLTHDPGSGGGKSGTCGEGNLTPIVEKKDEIV